MTITARTIRPSQSEGEEEEEEEEEEEDRGRRQRALHRRRRRNPPRDCNRGAGTAPLVQSRYAVRNQAHITSSENVNSLLAQLAAAHWDSDIHNPQAWLGEVGSALIMLKDDDKVSWKALIHRCSVFSAQGVRVSFLIMVHMILLTTKCQR
jgi:hypothetical protein